MDFNAFISAPKHLGTVALLLSSIRLHLGYSGRWLSTSLGFPQGWLSRFESFSTSRPKPERVRAMLQVYGVTHDQFMQLYATIRELSATDVRYREKLRCAIIAMYADTKPESEEETLESVHRNLRSQIFALISLVSQLPKNDVNSNVLPHLHRVSHTVLALCHAGDKLLSKT